jgi:hypothetical protein
LLALGLVLAGCANMAQRGGEGENRPSSDRQRTVSEESSPQEECPPDAPTDNIIADPASVSDRQLMEFADNVFVGRVVEKVGYEQPSQGMPPLPQTKFAVRVEENVKGSLSGTVVVVQEGGCDPRYGRVVVVNNDDLLNPGEEAVFSTKKQGPDGPYLIVGSNYGDIRVGTEREEDEVISNFRNSRKETVPFARPG